MFGKRNENKPQGRIDSLIGIGTRIEGNIHFAGGLRIDGEVKGSIEAAESSAASTLVLSEQARIEGSVNVAHVVVNGTILGPVTASESLELQAQARVVGDVEYTVIEIHQGAVIEGRLLHRGKTVELKLAANN